LSTTEEPESLFGDLISQAEAARLRGVSRQAIRKLIESGRFNAISVGGRRFVRRSEVMAYAPLQPGRPKKKEGE
jgi:excisionase family DNA binding protein